ncbi:MAG TPA: right-handed parallel beta-helix repeat-containing protein, partial [Acetobacteraceae bacterium]|nr:right-handed parallel beta-helix repeat-containing protein [Acetobacteraceae bacterium]
MRTPLVFETLEPRILLSSDPFTAAAQNLLIGLQSFENWTQTQLNHAAQLAQQLPVVSTSVGDLVDLPAQVQTHLVQPLQTYLASTSAPTVQGLVAALQADPAETGTVLGQFAQGELLITLSAFQTGAPINPSAPAPVNAPLNLAEDTAGINLQVAPVPVLSGQATVSLALTFGYAEAGNAAQLPAGFFIEPTTITEGVVLSASGFDTTATLGAANATVTDGSATVNATATVQLKDPVANDPANVITQAELAPAAVPLSSLVSTNLSGSASLTLPVSSSLVPGGPQTLTLNWSGNLSSVGSSNLSSLGAWAQLDTISPALLQQAVAGLPGLISAATGSAGFGANEPVIGQGLGQLLSLGTTFATAASAASGAASLAQVATALQDAGISVSFAVDTANNELDMQVSLSSAFDTTLPYEIDVPVGQDTLSLNGSLPVNGTATATLNLALSFDTSLPDSDRIQVLDNGSMLGLAFTAAAPIVATAMLGALRVQVNSGSIAVGAANGDTVDPTIPATATITFSGSNGRTTLAQLIANPAVAINAAYNGIVQAVLPLTQPANGSAATLGATWQLGQAAATPTITGADAAAALDVAPDSLTTDPNLDSEALAGLPTVAQWASALTTAADQSTLLSTQMPVLNQSLAQLTGLAPSTSTSFPGLLNEIASAISAYAVSGASTDGFTTSIADTLAAFSAANPGYTFTMGPGTSGGYIAATDTSALEALGLPAGTAQYVFNLNVTATYTESPTLSLTPGSSDDKIGFSVTGSATGTLGLNTTIAVADAPNLSAQDATTITLHSLTLGGTASVPQSFLIGIGLLGATVSSGSLVLDASAGVTMVSDGSGSPQANPVSAILGTTAGNLLNATQLTSTVTGALPVTSSFGDLTNASGTLTISGNPLSGAALTYLFTGAQATSFQSFANLDATDLVGSLSTLAGALTDIGQSSAMTTNVPLTNVTVGEAASFGSLFNSDLISEVNDARNNSPEFVSIQQFETLLTTIPGVTGSSVSHTDYNNEIEIGFTLAGSFASTPASFTYDLTGQSGTTLGNLTDVQSTSAEATLSIGGNGTVVVGFDLSLTPPSVQLRGATPVPTNGVLPVGADAHFTLSLTAPGNASPTDVNVTVASSTTHSNTTATQLLAEINSALQAALTGAGLAANLVTAGYVGNSSGGSLLTLTMVPGPFTDFQVLTAVNDPAVYELGLAPSVTPTATILGKAALANSTVIPSGTTITLTADGGSATPITIPAGTYNPSQLLSEIQTALAPFNATLTAANRLPVVVSLTSANILSFAISGYGSTLTLAATAATTQSALGLTPTASVEAGAPVVSVEASGGAVPSDDILTQNATFDITVDGLPTFEIAVDASATAGNTAVNAEADDTTPQQMLADEINAAMASLNGTLASMGLAEVMASIGTPASNANLDAGQTTTNSDGVLFFSTLGSSASIIVQGQAGNPLGIGPDDISVGPTLEMGAGLTFIANPNLEVAAGQSFTGNIALTQLSMDATLSVTGTIGATASLGVVAIDLGPTTVSYDATVAATVYASNLATLLAVPSQIGNYVQVTLGGTAAMTLPLAAAQGMDSAFGLDANASLALNATNVFQLSSWNTTGSDLEGLSSLQGLSFADVQEALTQLGSLVTESVASSSGLFGEMVPLINEPLGTALGITQGFTNLATDLQQGAKFSLDELQGALNAAVAQAFGLSTSGNYVTLTQSGSILKLTLNFTPSLSQVSVPLDVNLANLGLGANSNIPGVTSFTGSDLTLTPSASFNLVLDIDLTSPSNPVFDLDSATQFVLGLLLVGPSDGSIAMGPLGVTWAAGALALSKADGDTTDPATFAISLKSTTSLSTLTQDLSNNTWLGSFSPVTATITGQVTVNLPLSAEIGNTSSSLGTLTLTIPNLGGFVTDLFTNPGNISNDISFQPPSLTNAFQNLDLLGNVTDIIGALNNYLDELQNLLNGQLFGLNIPVIGNALASADSFVTQLKQAIDGIGSASEFQGVDEALTNALQQFDPPGPVVQLQYLESGGTVFQTFTLGEATSLLPSAQDIEAVQIDFNLGGTWTPATMPNFNLGLPGLGLNVSQGAVQVGVGWSLSFDLGIDRNNGPYIVVPSSGGNLTADIFANLSTTAAITAQLGFLALTASQPVPGQADPANNSVTAFQTGANVNFNAGFKNGSATLGGENILPVGSFGSNNLNISLAGSVGVDLDLSLGFDLTGGQVDTQYPNFTAELLVGTSLAATPGPWTFGVGLQGVNTTSPDVAFNNLELDLGSFLNNYLGKIINPLAQVVKPIEPFLNFLSTEIPIINEPLITAIVQLFGGNVNGLGQLTQFVDAIVNFVGDISNGSSLAVNLGSFNLDQFNLLMAPGSGGNSIPDYSNPQDLNSLLGDLQNSLSAPSTDGLTQAEDEDSGFSSFMGEVGSGSITFPILSNPMTLIGLMFGEQANLVIVTSPELTASASDSIDIPVYPAITADVVISVEVDARISAGYDTTGIVEAAQDIKAGASAYQIASDLADGFFINDAPMQSLLGMQPATFFGIGGMLGVGVSVGFGSLLSVGVGGGLGLNLSVSLKDYGPSDFGTPAYQQANYGDDKTRPSELLAWIDDFGNPLCAFNLNGNITADLFLEEQVLGLTFTQTLFNITVFSFTTGLNCSVQMENLGTLLPGGELELYTGPLWYLRDTGSAGPSEEGNDNFTVSEKAPGDILVTANDGSSEEFDGVTSLYATLGTGNNILNITTPLTQTDGDAINETIIGGTGSQEGNDTINAGGGDDVIEAGDGTAQIDGGTGKDTIYGGTTAEPGVSINIITSQSVDVLTNQTITVYQTVYGDTINGGTSGGNLIYGSYGSDVIVPSGSDNTVYGGPDLFNLLVTPNPNSLWGGPATFTTSVPNEITATGGNNLLVGGSGDDDIQTSGGSNTIIGGNGNNLLVGGPGSNKIYAGANPSYVNTEAALLASQTPPSSFAITNPGHASTPVPVPDQSTGQPGHSVVYGGSASLGPLLEYGNENEFVGLGLPVNNLPTSLPTNPAPAPDGPDTLYAGTAGDLIVGGSADNTIYGGIGPDTLVGGPSTDLITGGGGNELIYDRGTATILGGTGDDTIFGGPKSNTIYGDTAGGSGGNDVIQGGNSDNSIYGGTGDSTIYTGSGPDTVYGDSAGGHGGDDVIYGQGGPDTITGGTGNTTIYGGAGADTILGGSGNDYIGAGAGNDTVLGGSGDDTIYGDGGANTVFGGTGNDYISGVGGSSDSMFGGSGNDTMYGGGNDDTVSGGEGNDCIFGGIGTNQITGGSGNDTITGGSAFDVILGGTGSDSIQGGSDGDLIHGGLGADTIVGGEGPETIYAGNLSADITGGSGADLLVGGLAADTITGGSGPDTIYAGDQPGNVLSGGSGNDLIYGTDVVSPPGEGDTITGGSGDVTIWGSAGDDLIIGGSGNDVIYAGLGNQTIFGGTGTDLIYGGPGNDELFGDLTDTATTPDTIYGGTGTSTIMGNAGDDLLYGGDGRDSITGGGGDDVIYGGNGVGKTIVGGGGDATIWGSTGGGDSITGGAGDDEIFAEGGSDTVLGGSGNDTIEGELTGNLISGGTGNDLLVGGEGGDTINAGNPASSSPSYGQDTIYGDTGSTSPAVAGNDQLNGNAGDDMIYAGTGTNTIAQGTGPGTQVFNPGVATVATYAVTPIPEQNPELTAAANAAATLPTQVADSGVWATLAGGVGSSLATPTTNDGGPVIVADATTRYVAWISTLGGIPVVYVATESGTSWNQLAGSAQGGGISGLLQAASEPAIALLASGQPIIAWTAQTRSGTDIEVAEYSPSANGGAGGWVPLGNSLSAGGISQTGKASNAQILMVNGEPTVVWLDTSGGVSNIYARQFNGSTWVALGSGAASGGGISGSSLPITEFAAATNGTQLAVAWTQAFASAPTQIYVTQYSGGTWSSLGGSATGNGLSAALYAASAPTVAYLGNSMFVAWQQYITNPAQSETIFQQAPAIYTAEYTGGAWQPAGTGAETGFGVSDNANMSLAPKLASNGTQLILAWSNEWAEGDGTDTDLYVLTWNGTAFAAALPGQASGQGVAQSTGGLVDLSITLDPNGNPFAAWADLGDGAPALRVIGTPTTPAMVTVVTPSTLSAALNGPNAGSGDVIFLSAGSYGAITLGSSNNGLTIVGQPGLGAVINGTVIVTGNEITLEGVTIAGSITASGTGFALRESKQTSGTLTLSGENQLVIDSTLVGQGVSLQGAVGFELRGNTISSSGIGTEIGTNNDGTIDYNTISGTSVGINIANAFLGVIEDNVVTLSGIGVNYLAAAALSGNRIEKNTTGVVTTVDNADGGLGFVSGSGVNFISGNTTGVNLNGAQIQDQNISGNQVGVTGSGVIGGTNLSLANDINGNVTGISGFTGTIQYSRIDGNGTGILATSNQQILHNLIYNNTTAGLLVSGVSNIETSDNTFYTATGDNIRIENSSSNVEILNSILWVLNGYDIYIANNSQSGYFSDYNTLFAGPNGILIYWTQNFTDLLDWQDDVALYDLHSVGSTVPEPDNGMPHFVDLQANDFQLLPQVGGQAAADAALTQGDPIAEYDTQLQNGNLLANPDFEQGLTGWTTDAGAGAGVPSGGPAAYTDSSYFYGGAVTVGVSGYAEQTVNLLQAGYSPTLLDSGTLTVNFGGYTRSLAETTPDTSSITVTFLDANGDSLGSSTVDSPNATTDWLLTSGTATLPTGTRSIQFEFTVNAQSSDTTYNAYLDDAFLNFSTGSGPQSPLPGIGANYLINPGFQDGLASWTTSPGSVAAYAGEETGYPTPFTGANYYAAGAVQQGTASQTVNLLSVGLTAAEIDSGTLNLVFGGRVISANAFPADQGSITVTMYDANNNVLGTVTVQAPNTTTRWALVGGTTALIAGTRSVTYTFTATRQPGETYDESFLDDAFLSTAPIGAATADGAYQAPAMTDSTVPVSQIVLISPVLYVNWVNNAPHTITWQNIGNAGALNQSVNIALYQETSLGSGLPSEPVFLQTLATAVPNTGSFTWNPTPASIPYGTYGLIVQVTLVSDPAVFNRSTEAFTVPENGTNYYVNVTSAATDPGSNRNDGMSASEPLPNIDNVLRQYSLTSGSVIYVAGGTYPMIDPFDVSGELNYGLGLDQGFIVQGPTSGPAAILVPAIPGNLVNLIQLEDANLVTINDLTLENAGRGLYVQNSTGFSATGLTVSNMAYEGIRIDTNSAVTLLDNITVTDTGLVGIYINGTAGTVGDANVSDAGTSVPTYDASDANETSGLYITGAVNAISGTFDDNVGWGIYLAAPGTVDVTGSTIFGNGYGIYIDGSTGTATVGDPTLTDNDGNVVYDNANYGIYATGPVDVAGNVVYDEVGKNVYALEVHAGATALENVVYASQIGIVADAASLVSENRVYDNAQYGIESIDDASIGSGALVFSDNVIYSNGVGIYDDRYYDSSAVEFINNLIYANGTAAIQVFGNSNLSIIDNTIDQPAGDGIDISDANSGTDIGYNILVIGSGIGINISANSENGFVSNNNWFYLPGSGGEAAGSGAVGEWEGVLEVSLGAWQSTTLDDLNSFIGNPLFLNPDGAEGVLGYVSPSQPGFDDDFHLQSTYTAYAGGSLAPILNASGKPVFPTITAGADANESPAIDLGQTLAAGGYTNLGNFAFTPQTFVGPANNYPQASIGPSQYILVLSPQSGATVQSGVSTTITWRAYGFSGTVDIAYSVDGGSLTTIATGVSDTGSYSWSVPAGLTPASTYAIQITSDFAPSVFGTSQEFTITGQITDYYISPTGSNSNNGLSPSTPMASIQGLLTEYPTLGAGDTVFAAAGTYTVSTTISLPASTSGTNATNPFTIAGSTSGAPAVFDRGNLNSGQDVFDIQGASYIVIENITVTGGFNGIEIAN